MLFIPIGMSQKQSTRSERNPSFRTIYLVLILIQKGYFMAKRQEASEFFNTNTALEMK
jgi:hypothetical protein